MKLIAYTRVSTEEQGESGLGLAAQRETIERSPYGADAKLFFSDICSGAISPYERPALADALSFCREGEYDGIIVAKLDRLSRSVADFTALLECANREGWVLVILDLGVDTTTPNGRFLANVIASVAQLERDLISQRTKDALAAKKASGWKRDMATPEDVKAVISTERDKGMSYALIADKLNEDGVPTPKGGKRWYPSSVRSVATALV